jgi:hypothetical protein
VRLDVGHPGEKWLMCRRIATDAASGHRPRTRPSSSSENYSPLRAGTQSKNTSNYVQTGWSPEYFYLGKPAASWHVSVGRLAKSSYRRHDQRDNEPRIRRSSSSSKSGMSGEVQLHVAEALGAEVDPANSITFAYLVENAAVSSPSPAARQSRSRRWRPAGGIRSPRAATRPLAPGLRASTWRISANQSWRSVHAAFSAATAGTPTCPSRMPRCASIAGRPRTARRQGWLPDVTVTVWAAASGYWHSTITLGRFCRVRSYLVTTRTCERQD